VYSSFGSLTLKSGEKVEAAVVTAPDADWRPRLEKLLLHKDAIWGWQITQLLSHPLGVAARHYLLHRAGTPFCHIMTVDSGGVGILGHVWTQPADRGQGGASLLMQLQMEHFRAHGGQALYLSTGFESAAYRIYHKHGFESVEPQSGVMAYYKTSRVQFEREYFAPADTEIRRFDWAQWASASALFAGDWPGIVRNAAAGLLGRKLTEGALLPVVQRHHVEASAPPRALALQKSDNGAVVGVASWSDDALWPGVRVADVYCHPDFWQRAPKLLEQLALPSSRRVIAYADTSLSAKRQVLEAAGFRVLTPLPQWVARDAAKTGYEDVLMLERCE
jgi:GNAT superfamily N-acetyltransferase